MSTGRLKYIVLNKEEVEWFKSNLSIQDLWTYRVKNVVIASSTAIPAGHMEVINEGLLPYLSRTLNW